MTSVLIADDHVDLVASCLKSALRRFGDFSISKVNNPASCLSEVKANTFDFILLDVSFSIGHREGLTLVSEVRRLAPDSEIIMITSLDDPETITRCMAGGANDYISKSSFDCIDEIAEKMNKALLRRRSRENNVTEGRRIAESVGASFSSTCMAEIYAKVAQLRKEPSIHVLVTGSTGVGKDLVARAISRSEERKPFFSINSSCIGKDLLESELFGHEKGAFTGADRQKLGLFELANGGDIFFDEVATLSLEHQNKLLRAIQTGEFYRAGGNVLIKSKVRIIAATNEDLEDLVRKGLFREDLLQRLKRYHLHIPDLADRTEDIPAIVRTVISRSNKAHVEVPKEVMALLTSRPWKRNVRELEDCVMAGLMNCEGKYLSTGDLPRGVFESEDATDSRDHSQEAFTFVAGSHQSLDDATREFQTRYIANLVQQMKRPVTMDKLAHRLQVPRSTIARRIKEFGIELPKCSEIQS